MIFNHLNYLIKKHITNRILFSIDEIKQAVSDIKINNAPDDFKQIKGIKYNLVDPPKINKISVNHKKYFPDKIFNLILKESIDKILTTKDKFCNKETSCDLILKDSRILKGKNTNNNLF